MAAEAANTKITVDFVSDVVCPWCVIGFKQLEAAVEQTGLEIDLRWHPFELNPTMPAEGQDMGEHLQQKYGITEEQGAAARQRMTALGNELGFHFNMDKRSRMVNTFKAHKLLNWAQSLGVQTEMEKALFTAYFTDGKDVSAEAVLLDVAQSLGLDREEAAAVIANAELDNTVKAHEQFWTQQGITGVPAIIFDQKYLVSGAQGVDAMKNVLQKVAEEQAA